jgi:hypothetical protein
MKNTPNTPTKGIFFTPHKNCGHSHCPRISCEIEKAFLDFTHAIIYINM